MQHNSWKTYVGQQLELDRNLHIFKFKVTDCIKNISTNVLSNYEVKKLNRFHHQKDKDAYMVRKYFVRILIAKYLKIQPDQVHFSVVANKKPHVKGIEFNCSHSENYLLIGIASIPIGVDIQFMDKNFDISLLLELCLTTNELLKLNSPTHQDQNFYKFWTRKEALLKATGEGLVDQLNQVEVLQSSIIRNNHSYQLNTIQDIDYMMSFCYLSEKELDFHFWNGISIA